MSVNPKELSAKIAGFYPELEKYGVKMNTEFEAGKNAWIVTLTKGKDVKKTHIEKEDAEKCLQGIECVHLGIHVGDFIRVYCEGGEACKV